MILVFTTVPTVEESEALATKLVDGNLAACVQILPQMTSVYVWEGKLEKESEHLLLIKTLPEKWDELRDFITANNSYDVPEIIAVDIDKVSEKYSAWLQNALTTT